MSKEKELTRINKGTANFNLVGRAKVSDFTCKRDVESSKSDWIYNQLNLGIECGNDGIIYTDLMGGYGSERENTVFVHGKDENGKDDWKNTFKIDWEDREEEDILKTIGDQCFITVGLEKDDKGKTIVKRFITPYDAIAYIDEHLENDTIVNIKGNLTYQKYNDTWSIKKELKSIFLSNATEDKFKATFTQTILVESDAIGKPDKENMVVPITANIIEFQKEFNGQTVLNNEKYTSGKNKGKNKIGLNLPFAKEMYVKINEEDKDKTTRFLKQFKAKPKKVTEITVEGIFTKGALETEQIDENDIPDDIKELIELGIIEKDEVIGKMAFANGGSKPEMMIILKPQIKVIEDQNGNKTPSLMKEKDKYNEDDINPLLIIEQFGKLEESEDNSNSYNNDVENDDEDTADKLMEEDNGLEDEDDEDDNWLDEL